MVIDIFSKYTWVTNAFQKKLDEPNHKPNKIWIDKGSEFYNRLMKCLEKSAIEMYSTLHEKNPLLLKGSLEP